MRMDIRIKAMWLKDLFSGRIKQGKGHLQDNNTYCCLGVLTRRYIIETYGKKKIDKDVLYDLWETGDGTLHPTVAKWAGLRGKNKLDPKINGHNLSEYNDGIGPGEVPSKDFKEIGKMIEKQL